MLVAGVAVVVRPLAVIAQPASFDARMTAYGSAWRSGAATAVRRIDGLPKVIGAKLYAADFRAQDMPGWPRQTAHALLLKTPDATHVFEGIDLARLDRELTPDRIVLAEDLTKAGITVPSFYAGDLLCPSGKTPLYLGQPAALLIWNDFARFALAKRALQFAKGVLRFGAQSGPVAEKPYAAARFPRVAGPTRRPRTSTRPCSPDGPFRPSTRRMIDRNGRCRRRPAPTQAARLSTATRSAPRSTRPVPTGSCSSARSRPIDRPGVHGAGGGAPGTTAAPASSSS